jgi:hypothetical protein
MPPVNLRFMPFQEAAGGPNVVVDGEATTGTVLTLSHRPGSPDVPSDVEADLSAQMAFRYLEHHEPLHGHATVVSNDHFDKDGLASIFALAEPEQARARRPLLEDLAATGDFATYRHRDVARASMAVSAFADPARSPFALPTGDDADLTALLYTELLPRLTDLLDDVDRYRHLWKEEDAELSLSEAAVVRGAVRIEEHAEADLAVVTVAGHRRWSDHRFGGHGGVHPMAIHNATTCSSLLLVADGSYRFTYRYEGWVKYRSRPIPRRVDLGPLAHALSAADGVAWTCDPVDVITPELLHQGGAGSTLAPDVVTAMVLQHLTTAPPAFDPFQSAAGPAN